MGGKYSQKPLDHVKQSATDVLKTNSKRLIQKTAEATGDLIGNKISDAVAKSHDGKITKVSKNSPQNSLENDKETSKERYISREKRQKIIDDLRLI